MIEKVGQVGQPRHIGAEETMRVDQAEDLLMTSDFETIWYLVATAPAQEGRALNNLRLNGVGTWLPKCSRIGKQAGKMRFVERVLFPGYVFVGFDPQAERWMTVREAGGVVGVIGADGLPLRIPRLVMGELMSRCLRGDFDIGQRRVGSRVLVSAGEHKGVLGRVVKVAVDGDPDQAVTVLLSACGAPHYAQMPLDALEIAA